MLYRLRVDDQLLSRLKTSIQLAAKTSPMNRAPMTLLFPLVGSARCWTAARKSQDRTGAAAESGEILAGKTPRGFPMGLAGPELRPMAQALQPEFAWRQANLRTVKDGRHRDGR